MPILTPDETILGLLAVHARHGYDLLELFQDPRQLGRVWSLSTSQIYNVLKRLERELWVVGREIASPSGPPRIEYALAEAGHQRLLDWLHEPAPSASIRRVRVEFLSRLFIAQQLRMPVEGIVDRQRDACLRERERLMSDRDISAPGIEDLVMDLVIRQLDALLDWIDHCKRALSTQ